MNQMPQNICGTVKIVVFETETATLVSKINYV